MRRLGIAMVAAVASFGLVIAATQAGAADPGENGRIAFVGPAEGKELEIHSLDRDGGDLQRLTHVDGNANDPDWSADGTQIVFGFDPPDDTCSIVLMNADGTGMVDLTGERRGCESNPSFTPDGGRIVFVVQRCNTCREAIWSMDTTGDNRQRIMLSPRVSGSALDLIDPNASPDGSTVAFVGARSESRAGLYTVAIDGSHRERIVPFSFRLGTHFGWAPDGRRIVFTEYATGPGNLVTIRPDGSGLVRVTHHEGDVGAGGASYSPDGRWIVFRRQNDGTERFSLWKMHPDGTYMTRIRRLPYLFGGVDWGPRPT